MNLKVHYYCRLSLPEISKQTLKIMKLIAVILFAACIQVSARGYSQITLSEHNAPLQKVFQKIQQQSGYDFVSTYAALREAGTVTIKVRNVSLQKALEECLRGKSLTYVIIGKTVVVQTKEKDYYNASSIIVPEILPPPPIEIHGRVVNQEGEPLQNVSVLISGTTIGTTTDNDGRFTINAPDNKNIILEISSIGFQTKKVNVGKQTEINVVLELDVSGLSDIVVVGYGTQRKGNVTAAISSVGFRELSQSAIPNVSNLLAGRVSGVTAIQPQGTPGNDQTLIYVRGIATTGNTAPLYVIDGVPRTAADFNRLSATEIESISVLKDASAAAVYGARGANGVILISTKRGKEGKLSLSYSFNYGIQKATRLPDYVDAAEYATLYDAALVNEGRPELYTDEAIQKYRDGSDPIFYPNTDWLSVLRGSAPMQQHNLTATGGTDKANYYVSFNYLNQENLLNSGGNSNFGFKRYNFRSNVDIKATNTTRVAFDVSGYMGKASDPGQSYSYIFENINRAASVYAGKYPNGLWGPAANNRNGWAAAYESGYQNNETDGLLTRLQITQDIPFVKGLSLRGVAAYDYKPTNNKTWLLPVKTYVAVNDNDNVRYDQLTGTDNPSLIQYNGTSQSTLLELHGMYNRTFGNHGINALFLYSQQAERFADMSVTRKDYLSDQLEIINAGGTVNQSTTGDATQYRRQSLVGRLSYNYDRSYLLEFSFRRDGSTLFAEGRRFGFFPAVSAGWVMSNESFMKKIDFVNYLKLRASYGELGNDQIGSYQYLTFYGFGPGVAMGTAGSFQNNIFLRRLANPDVTWETARKTNIGFEATALFDFSIEADYFIERRTNILGQRSATIPATMGTPAGVLPFENFQKVDNKGFEIVLGYNKRISDHLNIQSRISITHAKNMVVDIGEPASKPNRIMQAGRPLNPVYGYKAIGYFQSAEEISKAYGNNYPFVQPGDIKYEDLNGDRLINGDDVTYIGSNNLPVNIFGWQTSVTFGNFEGSMFWQAGTGNEQYFNNWMAKPFNGAGNALKIHENYWTPENRNAAYPRILTSSSWNYDNVSSFWLYDMSYLRLKNLQIAYNFPASIASRIRAQQLRVYLNGANLLTFSKFKEVDPENTNSMGHYYPQQIIFNGGIQVTF